MENKHTPSARPSGLLFGLWLTVVTNHQPATVTKIDKNDIVKSDGT